MQSLSSAQHEAAVTAATSLVLAWALWSAAPDFSGSAGAAWCLLALTALSLALEYLHERDLSSLLRGRAGAPPGLAVGLLSVPWACCALHAKEAREGARDQGAGAKLDPGTTLALACASAQLASTLCTLCWRAHRRQHVGSVLRVARHLSQALAAASPALARALAGLSERWRASRWLGGAASLLTRPVSSFFPRAFPSSQPPPSPRRTPHTPSGGAAADAGSEPESNTDEEEGTPGKFWRGPELTWSSPLVALAAASCVLACLQVAFACEVLLNDQPYARVASRPLAQLAALVLFAAWAPALTRSTLGALTHGESALAAAAAAQLAAWGLWSPLEGTAHLARIVLLAAVAAPVLCWLLRRSRLGEGLPGEDEGFFSDEAATPRARERTPDLEDELLLEAEQGSLSARGADKSAAARKLPASAPARPPLSPGVRFGSPGTSGAEAPQTPPTARRAAALQADTGTPPPGLDVGGLPGSSEVSSSPWSRSLARVGLAAGACVTTLLFLAPARWCLGLALASWVSAALCAYWAALLAVSLPLMTRLARRRSVPQILVRKGYHLLALLLFLPGLLLDARLLSAALAVAFAALAAAEAMRLGRLGRLSRAIEGFMGEFVDARDGGAFYCTHFALLLGMAAPLWAAGSQGIGESVSNAGQVAAWSLATYEAAYDPEDAEGSVFYITLLPHCAAAAGVVALGLGDACASLAGRLWGRTPIAPGSRKTLEGALGGGAAMLAGWGLLLQFAYGAQSWHLLRALIPAAALSSLLEASTGQLDNVVLPAHAFALIAALL